MPHPHLIQVQELALHRYLGVRVVEALDGRSRIELPVTEANSNPTRVLHGGVVYAVCDVAAYLALISLLNEHEGAVTHDIHVSCMRPAPLGSTVCVTAHVVQRGRSLAFLDAQVMLGDKRVATARVTKTIVALDTPTT